MTASNRQGQAGAGRAEWLQQARAHLRDADPVLARQADDQLIAELTEIPGIGPWTAQGALIIALGREDVVLPGDLALRKAIRSTYDLDHLPAEEEVVAIAAKWRPYRSLATSYLFAAAFEEARRAAARAGVPEWPRGRGHSARRGRGSQDGGQRRRGSVGGREA